MPGQEMVAVWERRACHRRRNGRDVTFYQLFQSRTHTSQYEQLVDVTLSTDEDEDVVRDV
jgi:type IV secretory pathway TraG/TraD family ATPase VirD4